MLKITNEQFKAAITDLKTTEDIKEFIKTTIGNLSSLYEEADGNVSPEQLYSLGDAINMLQLLAE